MKNKTIIIILSIILIIESVLLYNALIVAVEEHDLRVIECHESNKLRELSNMMLIDYGIKELEYKECEEPFDKSVLIKLKEIENE